MYYKKFVTAKFQKLPLNSYSIHQTPKIGFNHLHLYLISVYVFNYRMVPAYSCSEILPVPGNLQNFNNYSNDDLFRVLFQGIRKQTNKPKTKEWDILINLNNCSWIRCLAEPQNTFESSQHHHQTIVVKLSFFYQSES